MKNASMRRLIQPTGQAAVSSGQFAALACSSYAARILSALRPDPFGGPGSSMAERKASEKAMTSAVCEPAPRIGGLPFFITVA